MSNLTQKQRRFIDEYLIDLNGAAAARRAGYSPRTANRMAAENMAKPVIAEAIKEAMAERSERLKVDAGYVLYRLVEIDQMSLADIIDEEGCLRPISEWPQTWKHYITSVDFEGDKEAVREVREGLARVNQIKKIRWPDKLKNLELIGRHITVRAFDIKNKSPGDDLPILILHDPRSPMSEEDREKYFGSK